MSLSFRFSGGQFKQMEPIVRQVVEQNAAGIAATGLTEQAVADAVELIMKGESDQALLRLEIKIPRR